MARTRTPLDLKRLLSEQAALDGRNNAEPYRFCRRYRNRSGVKACDRQSYFDHKAARSPRRLNLPSSAGPDYGTCLKRSVAGPSSQSYSSRTDQKVESQCRSRLVKAGIRPFIHAY